MDDKKKKIEEINKIYQNPISSEEEKQKQKLTELYKSIHEPLTSVEKQKQQERELLKNSFSSAKSSISDILASEIPNNMDDKKKKIEEANKIYRNMITGNIFDVNKSFENLLTPEKQIKKEMDLLSKSIKNVQNSMQDGLLEDKYIDRYSDIAQNLSEKKEFLETSIDLTSLGKEINNEIYKYKMADINHREKLFHDFEHAKPIEFRNYAHEMLEEFKIQNEKLSTVIEHLKTQNESLDIQIKQDKASSEKQIYKLQEQIESNNLASKKIIDENKKTANEQIQLLKEQIDKSDASFEKQLEDSRKSMKWTIGIAVVSIAIAIGSTIWSLNKTEEIYIKENDSGDKQHKELKEILENNSNKDLIFEDKQLKVLNQILESIKENKLSEKK